MFDNVSKFIVVDSIVKLHLIMKHTFSHDFPIPFYEQTLLHLMIFSTAINWRNIHQ